MIYIKGKKSTNRRLKKKKDKVANQNKSIDEQWKTLYEQCKNAEEKRAQIDDWEKKKKKAMNSTCWTNQKYCSFYIFTQQMS